MKGKPGQECSLGIETKVRRGPERKGDKVITDLLRRTMMLTMFCLSPASMTDLCPPSGTAEEKDQSALCGTPSSLPLSVSHLTSQVDALQCCTLRQLPAAVYSPARQEYAGRICNIIRSRQELDGCFSIMLKSLFVYGVLGVLLIPASCDPISVCYEDDNDLRVDCWVEPKANKISSYEFSWSSGTKESLINTNVSGSSAESQFKDKSYVEELEEPQGYRMTLKGFTDTLPHNTTYMCKISGVTARITVQKDELAMCSAVSVFLKSSCSWIVCLLLFFYQTHS